MNTHNMRHGPAVLALADGEVFHGQAIGVHGHAVGEVVFNTAMTGYQEILTDPSYAGQLVTLTCPHIGNVGVNPDDDESGRVHAAGLIIREPSPIVSNFRGTQSLAELLRARQVVGIAGIDTRRLTRILRDRGAQSGAIVAGSDDAAQAIALARAFPGLAGADLARHVSSPAPYAWTEGEWQATAQGPRPAPRFHVVAFDYGVKRNILRMLAQRGARVSVLPAQTPAADALALKPDGIFLSNGPGDPAACTYAIAAARMLIDSGIPVFGICLGHQIMALASGARTLKMKFGHHGANHPVQELATGRVMITSQNHGFAVDPDTLPARCKVTHVSLFDGSIQGIARTDRPAFSFQGHPEASPGPRDIAALFDQFTTLMETHRHA